ncbi:ATP-binding protein [Actinomadura rupiterrae]|uniref:ATP-binding protein n=1 Tax=Actinomadura rupiterrae TaxID=559627 RepID=UPI0020A407DF|nr:ATP-binding protein [Actinomadura rupiterrae]MCP2343632.1 anti-sigma regulatory factor (Ser/Thr protein kinase) [Actinomadura rupiterrae]
MVRIERSRRRESNVFLDGDPEPRPPRARGFGLGTRSADEWLWGPDEMRWRRAFSGRPEQVALAREFAGALLAGAECLDVVEFVVSELTANTIRHSRTAEAGGWFGLELVFDDPVYVAVVDNGGRGVPAVKEPVDLLATSGRGLYAVSQLVCRMGIEGNPQCGHKVWAEVALDRELGAGLL